ncbi:glyceraldehyde-3-phosphate dehydrogenase-likefamily protein [Striga asiatica]|uniref:Glyceraldehyde-3-phosphate dehydrogenase-likefamily protein n=1 Tax=Striga asiatica TaxID=4170 RepID=A0A5A7QNA5_STRAF|nr:glyceraldehyde-3-phosphate dehydrogenase-likefamily protein [Striga asiatica]
MEKDLQGVELGPSFLGIQDDFRHAKFFDQFIEKFSLREKSPNSKTLGLRQIDRHSPLHRRRSSSPASSEIGTTSGLQMSDKAGMSGFLQLSTGSSAMAGRSCGARLVGILSERTEIEILPTRTFPHDIKFLVETITAGRIDKIANDSEPESRHQLKLHQIKQKHTNNYIRENNVYWYTYGVKKAGFGAIISGEEKIRSCDGGHHCRPPHKLVGSWVHFRISNSFFRKELADGQGELRTAFKGGNRRTSHSSRSF